MEIKFDEEKELENMNSINILNNQHCFFIKQEHSKIIISLSKDSNYIYEYCAFIDYKKKENEYEIIIRLYNIYGKESNNVKYNELLKLKRKIILNRLNFKNILGKMIYMLINSIFIKNTKFNILKNDLREITIIYELKKVKNNEENRIFGNKFVKNNKSKLILIINGISRKLKEKIIIKDTYNKNRIRVKIIEIKKISNLSNMFAGCNNITKISMISNLNTSNVTDMSGIFYNCELLEEIPDISNWNTSNVKNMSRIFYNCELLKEIPDISNWNTNNVRNMDGIFYNCKSLKEIPDISNWNTSNVTNMSYIFSNCKSLKEIPDISNWNTSNVINMSGIFEHCESLKKLPDISNWNTSNIINMSGIFQHCESLKK